MLAIADGRSAVDVRCQCYLLVKPPLHTVVVGHRANQLEVTPTCQASVASVLQNRVGAKVRRECGMCNHDALVRSSPISRVCQLCSMEIG
jgi:hypothetical protein